MGFVELTGWFVVALGAALALGTGAALLAYRRDGVFPGQPADPAQDDGPPPATRITFALVKLVLGVVVALAGLAMLVSQGVIG